MSEYLFKEKSIFLGLRIVCLGLQRNVNSIQFESNLALRLKRPTGIEIQVAINQPTKIILACTDGGLFGFQMLANSLHVFSNLVQGTTFIQITERFLLFELPGKVRQKIERNG